MNTIIYKTNSPEKEGKKEFNIIKEGNKGFDIINYPDGQRNIKIHCEELNIKELVTIRCRIKRFSDFEILFLLKDALRREGFYVDVIEMVYLCGLRSDRVFEDVSANYYNLLLFLLNDLAKDCNCVIYKPHRIHLLEKITRFRVREASFDLPLNALDLIPIGADQSYELPHSFNPNVLVGAFNKSRKDNIVNVSLCEPIHYVLKNTPANICIMDDLCDGGATVIAEAEYLKEHFPEKKIYLYIDHALFTKGVEHVAKHFEYIFCTNSYQDIDHPKVIQKRVI